MDLLTTIKVSIVRLVANIVVSGNPHSSMGLEYIQSIKHNLNTAPNLTDGQKKVIHDMIAEYEIIWEGGPDIGSASKQYVTIHDYLLKFAFNVFSGMGRVSKSMFTTTMENVSEVIEANASVMTADECHSLAKLGYAYTKLYIQSLDPHDMTNSTYISTNNMYEINTILKPRKQVQGKSIKSELWSFETVSKGSVRLPHTAKKFQTDTEIADENLNDMKFPYPLPDGVDENKARLSDFNYDKRDKFKLNFIAMNKHKEFFLGVHCEKYERHYVVKLDTRNNALADAISEKFSAARNLKYSSIQSLGLSAEHQAFKNVKISLDMLNLTVDTVDPYNYCYKYSNIDKTEFDVRESDVSIVKFFMHELVVFLTKHSIPFTYIEKDGSIYTRSHIVNVLIPYMNEKYSIEPDRQLLVEDVVARFDMTYIKHTVE